MVEKKNELLVIRTTREVRVEFKRFAADFQTYSDALRFLLEKARELGLKPGRYL